MSFGPNLNVWTRGKGGSRKWTLRHTTDRLDEAMAWFAQLDGEGQNVALYELGLFLHEGQQVAGQVGFWWNAGLNDYMTRESVGRGHGWTEEFDTWVEYTYPEPERLPQAGPWGAPVVASPQDVGEPSLAIEPEERYVEDACEHCGRIMPRNQLQRLTHDVQSGRTSGSRSTHGHGSRHSTRLSQGRVSFSNSSSSGSASSSSSRTYYKTETLLLCDDCYAKQTQADHPVMSFLTRLFE